MEINWLAVGAALIAGLSTGIGALPIFFKKELSKKSLDLGMGFSAGIMLVASFIALILPGLEEGEKLFGRQLAPLFVLSGLIIGYLFIVAVHQVLPHEHLIKNEEHAKSKRLTRVGMIILAITLHNFPEGLSVGVGFGSNVASGYSLALAIAIQNMPEGLVVAIGLLSEGATKRKAFLLALLSGMVEPVAALIGFISTQFTALALPIALGFAGGAMLFVTCQEIFPELFREGHEKRATVGVISGIVLMLLLDFYLG